MTSELDEYYEYINLESFNESLICHKCNRPLIEPVQTPCQHIFCRQCLGRSLDDQYFRCSICNESYSNESLTPITDSSILTALDRVLVKCKLCNETNIERVHLENHVYKMCPKAIVTCPSREKECFWIGLREDLHTHLSPSPPTTLTSDAQTGDDLDETFDKCYISEESHGEFLPFRKVNFEQRNFRNQDLAVAVKALIINKRCTYLDLFSKGITAKGASVIASVLADDKSLETLGFRNNVICDSGVQYITHALSTNTYLKRLDLNNNSITDTGVRLLADMLRTNQTLIKLTLSYNKITNEGMSVLTDVLVNHNSTLQWLSIAGHPAITDASTHSIRHLIHHNQSLTNLNMEDCGISWWSKAQIYFYKAININSNLDLSL